MLLVTPHDDTFADEIALADVTFLFKCAKNALSGSNKVIRMFIQANSQGVKIARLADDAVFVHR